MGLEAPVEILKMGLKLLLHINIAWVTLATGLHPRVYQNGPNLRAFVSTSP